MAEGMAVRAARAMYRGYFSNGRKQSSLVRRLHVIRDTPVRSNSYRFHPVRPEVTWCGQSAGPHRNSEPVILDPIPSRPPEGLTWCPKCVGHLAEHYQLLDEIAASLAAFDPEIGQ